MPRQTFLSRESFLESSEKRTREVLTLLSEHAANISFVADNRLTGGLRFCYVSRSRNAAYNIDVSVLPLNDQYTRLCLHASHTNEEAFYENPDMAYALHDMEAGIQAMVGGDFSYFRQKENIPVASRSFSINHLRSVFDVFFLRKKLS